MRRIRDKLKSLEELIDEINSLRVREVKIVFTNGCFDILHSGHVYYLEEARLLGDFLIVGVNADASVKRLKGINRPINSLHDRMYVLAALECVDFVVSFEEDTPLNLIKMIKPDVIVKGGDWRVADIVGAKEVISWGGKVETIPFKSGRSTSLVIKKIKEEGL